MYGKTDLRMRPPKSYFDAAHFFPLVESSHPPVIFNGGNFKTQLEKTPPQNHRAINCTRRRAAPPVLVSRTIALAESTCALKESTSLGHGEVSSTG